MTSATRGVNEGLQQQGVDEIITYTLTTTPWGSTPTSIVVGVDDRTNVSLTGAIDVTATVMPTNTPVAAGDVITLSPLKLLTAGHLYRVEVKFTAASGNTFEPYFDVLGVD